MRIWIDADACPKAIKELVYRASFRTKIPVILVANSSQLIPKDPLISLEVVANQADAADLYIIEKCVPGDLVITADIPLASAVVAKEVLAINPRGEVYTEENVQEALAMRNLMKDLRDTGLIQGGPAPMGSKETALFANALNRELTKLLK